MVTTRVSKRKSTERPKRQRRSSTKFDNSSREAAPPRKEVKNNNDNKRKKAEAAPAQKKKVEKKTEPKSKKKEQPQKAKAVPKAKVAKVENNTSKKTAEKIEKSNADNNDNDQSTVLQKEARVRLRVDGKLSKGYRYAQWNSSSSSSSKKDKKAQKKPTVAKRSKSSAKSGDNNIRVRVKLDKQVRVQVRVQKKKMKGDQYALVTDDVLNDDGEEEPLIAVRKKKPPKITIRVTKKDKDKSSNDEDEGVATNEKKDDDAATNAMKDDAAVATKKKKDDAAVATKKKKDDAAAATKKKKDDAVPTNGEKKRAKNDKDKDDVEGVPDEMEQRSPPPKKAKISQFGNDIDPKRLCIIDGCDKYKKARCGGYCLLHYEGLAEEEKAEIALKNDMKSMKMAPEKKRCKVEGCGKYFKAKHDGFCLTCYREYHGIQKKKNGSSDDGAPDLPSFASPLAEGSGQKSAKYCIFEGCMKYKQKGCLGYCLTHKEFRNPELHRLQSEIAAAESAIKKKINKSSLCKEEGCNKYKQGNCGGYCLEHVKVKKTYDDDDLEDVTKVRVRCDNRLQNGFCVAILSDENRSKLGLKRPLSMSDEDVVTSDEEDSMSDEDEIVGDGNDDEEQGEGKEPNAAATANAAATEQAGQPDFKISSQIRRKENGALLCRAAGCPKIAQTKDNGFCRTHFNRYQISTGKCESWECKCGQKIATSSLRCGKCHRWKDGHHPAYSPSPRKSPAASSSSAYDGASQQPRTYVPEDAGVEISDVILKNERGRPLCKVIGCGKAEQAHNDGFCRTHFNQFAIPEDGAEEDSSEKWTCECGEKWSLRQKRCGNTSCQKWQGGKREPYTVNRNHGISDDNIINDSKWKCDNCGEEVEMRKSRCGSCHRWRGGKRQGGWTLGSAANYDSDDGGIDWSQDWTCDNCNDVEVIPANQTRCGKCNRWRGGKRRPASWECSKCNLSNPGGKKRCAGCLTWRGKTKKAKETVAVASQPVSSYNLPVPAMMPKSQSATVAQPAQQSNTTLQASTQVPALPDFGVIDFTKLSFVNYDFNQSYYESSDYSYLTGPSKNETKNETEITEEKKDEVETTSVSETSC